MNNKTGSRFTNLPDWLHWQEQLHPNPIDMGLERVQLVLQRMQLDQLAFRVLTVGGTNGKGSCVTFLDAILQAQGYRVGKYMSPHLAYYNERVTVAGREADDQEFCEAFAAIDAVRGETSLTYFEFGTLAALDIFRRHQVDVAVLEVGMGGRLDAVNAVTPDAALISSIGLDHQEWLGNDRDSIGYEKAGIYRANRPAICGDRDPPARLLETTQRLGAELKILGRDFDWTAAGTSWSWRQGTTVIENLPQPSLPGRIQFDNVSSVLAMLHALPVLSVSNDAIRSGIVQAHLPARFERVPGDVELIFDVAHNPDAAKVLAENLAATRGYGRTFAVLGMFRDKAAEAVAELLAPEIDAWYIGGLDGPRGQTAAVLAARIKAAVPEAILYQHPSVTAAGMAAHAAARAGDRIVICGSFQTVAAMWQQVHTKAINISR